MSSATSSVSNGATTATTDNGNGITAVVESASSSSSSSSLTPAQVRAFSEVAQEVSAQGRSLIFYDAVCLVCNTTINFITDHDPEGKFYFATLQSDFASYVYSTLGVPPIDSMILVEGGQASTWQSAPFYSRSTAMLRILMRLQPSWLFSLIGLLLLIPAVLRDLGYKAFAACRYRIFGKVDDGDAEACRVMTKDLRKRFVEYTIRAKIKSYAKEEGSTTTTEGDATSPPPVLEAAPVATESSSDAATEEAPESTSSQDAPQSNGTKAEKRKKKQAAAAAAAH